MTPHHLVFNVRMLELRDELSSRNLDDPCVYRTVSDPCISNSDDPCVYRTVSDPCISNSDDPCVYRTVSDPCISHSDDPLTTLVSPTVSDEDACNAVYLELDDVYGDLDSYLIQAEEDTTRMNRKLEACGCDVTCQWAGRVVMPDAEWLADPCTACRCHMGEVLCHTSSRLQCQDPCLAHPCASGATCTSSPGYRNFTCRCPPGLSGERCQHSSYSCPTARGQHICQQQDRRFDRYVLDPVNASCTLVTVCESEAELGFLSESECQNYCTVGVCCVVPVISSTNVPDCMESSLQECRSLATAEDLAVVSFSPNTTTLEPPDLLSLPGTCECWEAGSSRVRQEVTTLQPRRLQDLTRAFRSLYINGWPQTFTLAYAKHVMAAHDPRAWLGVNRVVVRAVEAELQRVGGGCHLRLPYWDYTTHAHRLSENDVWRRIPATPGLNVRLATNADQKGNTTQSERPLHPVGTVADLVLALRHHDFEPMAEALWQEVSRVVSSAGGTLASLDGPMDPVFFLLAAFVDQLFARWQEQHTQPPTYARHLLLRPFNVTLLEAWVPDWSCGTYERFSWAGDCEEPPEAVAAGELARVSASLLDALSGQPREFLELLKLDPEERSSGPETHGDGGSRSLQEELEERMMSWRGLTWREGDGAASYVVTTPTPAVAAPAGSHPASSAAVPADATTAPTTATTAVPAPRRIQGLEGMGVRSEWIAWWCGCRGPRAPCGDQIVAQLTQHVNLLSNITADGATITSSPTVNTCGRCDIAWHSPYDEDPCASSPCMNGGQCLVFGRGRRGSYQCLCDPSHRGRRCATRAPPNCFLPPALGRCSPGARQNTSQRWYYSPREGTCLSFTFSGCGGNSNNHPSYSACLHACTRGTCCRLKPAHDYNWPRDVEELASGVGHAEENSTLVTGDAHNSSQQQQLVHFAHTSLTVTGLTQGRHLAGKLCVFLTSL
ncbi:uncharacterized protein [Panulirus ornatus]|uniref:uncharacterized protein n=1 Tax=Panulirus ornatus TaxID=150431 RepID=UPI003A8B111C